MATLADWLREEPFTLTMSSGFFGFFAHAGMLAALETEDLVPSKVTGSSSGALVGSLWASGLDSTELSSALFSVKRKDFWDPGFGLGLLKGEKFKQLLAKFFKAQTIEECRVPVSLSAYNMTTKQVEVFKSGSLVEATYASCAIPFMFHPLKLETGRYIDGGVSDRAGLADINDSEGGKERVLYHHIASRSPWRKKGSDSIKVPQRNNLMALVLHDLPRSGPTKLEEGPRIYELAKHATLKALRSPTHGKSCLNLAV